MKLSKSTRIYIAGCGGMLGDAVYKHFRDIAHVKATDINVNEEWLSYADVRDYRGALESLESFRPDIVINLAALTDLEQCERDPDNAWCTNALGAENLALMSSRLDAVHVYISTAGVFDGGQSLYTEFDAPRPLNVYGRSKYYGEAAIPQRVPRHFVIRAGWMMGGGPAKDKKFINKLFQKIRAGARELSVVDDKFGSPTYTVDFARGIQVLVESELYGLYHQSGEGSNSRYEVAQEFVRLLGLEQSVTIKKVDSTFFEGEYFATRPTSEGLVNFKLRARGLNVMREWRVCLEEYSRIFREDLESRR